MANLDRHAQLVDRPPGGARGLDAQRAPRLRPGREARPARRWNDPGVHRRGLSRHPHLLPDRLAGRNRRWPRRQRLHGRGLEREEERSIWEGHDHRRWRIVLGSPVGNPRGPGLPAQRLRPVARSGRKPVSRRDDLSEREPGAPHPPRRNHRGFRRRVLRRHLDDARRRRWSRAAGARRIRFRRGGGRPMEACTSWRTIASGR